MEALRTRGGDALFCWGFVTSSQDDSVSVVPTVSGDASERFLDVSIGEDFECYVSTEGIASCRGRSRHGKLGRGETPSSGNPFWPRAPVVGPDHELWDEWVWVHAGAEHACGRRRDGRAYCWGRAELGRLGRADGPANRAGLVTEP